MNRADYALLKVIGETLAAEAKAGLNADGQAEWADNESRLNVELRRDGHGLGTVFASISQGGLTVTDEQVFLTWVQQHWPEEVRTVLAVRNPEWLRLLRTRLALEGTTPPGTDRVEGGGYLSTTYKADPAVPRAAKRLIRQQLQGDALQSPTELIRSLVAALDE